MRRGEVRRGERWDDVRDYQLTELHFGYRVSLGLGLSQRVHLKVRTPQYRSGAEDHTCTNHLSPRSIDTTKNE